jgi:hypothetical protein
MLTIIKRSNEKLFFEIQNFYLKLTWLKNYKLHTSMIWIGTIRYCQYLYYYSQYKTSIVYHHYMVLTVLCQSYIVMILILASLKESLILNLENIHFLILWKCVQYWNSLAYQNMNWIYSKSSLYYGLDTQPKCHFLYH